MTVRLLRQTAAAAFLAAATFGLAAPALAEFRLTILHTNDVHSRLEPINAQDSACGEKDAAENACFGGTARLATAIAERRAEAQTSILLDAGDQFQGSLFYTRYKGSEVAELMTRLGYDAMAIGNHEFDDGIPVLQAFADAIGFPLPMANADLSREPALGASIERRAVLEVGGERIGIIGLTPEDNGDLTIGGRTIDFTDPVAAARAEVAALTAAGVTKIVLLSHSSYTADQRIAAAVEGIDVVVGGHSHTLLSSSAEGAAGPYPTMVAAPDGAKVPIVQAGSYGKYLGEIEIVFDHAGRVVSAVGDPILIDTSFAEDAGIKARIAELAVPLVELRESVVAETLGAIDGGRETCRFGECAMGTLVADAMLARVEDQGVRIAIANGGGLRASIDAGPVTMGEVLTVLPFQNTLSTFRLKGSAVVEALENGLSQVEEGGGRFPQVAGIEFDWSASGEGGRSRVSAVRVKTRGGTEPIDPEADYLVVSNNFMRGGGDGYRVFADKGTDAYDYGPTLDAVLVEYLRAQGGAYRPYTDGRIRRLD